MAALPELRGTYWGSGWIWTSTALTGLSGSEWLRPSAGSQFWGSWLEPEREQAKTIAAPVFLPASRRPRQPGLSRLRRVYAIRPLETKGIDVFVPGGRLTCL